MLAALRKRSAGIIAKLLFLLLILSFGVWGIGDMLTTRGPGDSVAQVGDTEISGAAVLDEFNRDLRRMQSQLGDAIDRDRARAFGLDREVLQRLVTRTLYNQGAAELGVVAPDAKVAEAVRDQDAFKGAAGTFDRIRFSEVLRVSNLSERQYFDLVRGDLITGQYLDGVRRGTVVPSALAGSLFAFTAEKRVAETVTVRDAAMPGMAAPTETELADYHKNNAQRFTRPEVRALTVLNLKAADVASELAVSDDDLRAAFADRADEFRAPEKRRLSQFVVQTEADAQKARDLLNQGVSFEDVAKIVANMDPSALDLGEMERGQMLPELADAAFSAAAGTVSQPVKSPLGFHLVRVDAVTPASEVPFEQARAKLRDAIAKDRAIDGLYKLVNQTEDLLGGGATLEEAATALNLKPIKVAAVDRRGNGADGKPVAGLPGVPAFLDTAFTTDEGRDSLMVEAGADAYFVLRVDGVTPPALKPLDTVLADVIAGVAADSRRAQAEAKAKAIQDKAKAGTALTALAAELGTTATTTQPFERSNPGSLPGELVTNLFAAKPGDVVMARGKDGFTVARLTAVQPADPAANTDAVGNMAKQLSASLQDDVLSQLAIALQDKHPISVNDRAFRGLFEAAN